MQLRKLSANNITIMPDTSVKNVNANDLDTVQLANEAGTVANHDMSFWGLFINADFVVQAVIISLFTCSLWSWAIIFGKYSKFKLLKFKSNAFEKKFWSGGDLDTLYSKIKDRAGHPMAWVFCAAMNELNKSDARKSRQAELKVGIKERIAKSMQITRNRSVDNLEKGLGFLATVGSTAPFIGLFGTVWGIMNSFTSIAAASNTSLAIVAPGIAEALFATAIGLVAAIPAVIAYNKFSTELDKFTLRLEDFSDEFETLISRQLDEGKV